MLRKLHVKIRKWLVSNRWGVPIALLVAPLVLLPSDLNDRNGVYGRIARSYWHVIWTGCFFAVAFLKFSGAVISTVNPELLKMPLFDFISTGTLIDISYYIFSFLISCTAITVGAAIAYGFHKLSGTMIRKAGGTANIPEFKYFTMQWSVLFCWFGGFTWLLSYLVPYLTRREPFPDISHYFTEENWLVLVPFAIVTLLGMRREQVRFVGQKQMYPNSAVGLLVGLASIALLALSMLAIAHLQM